MYYRALIKVLVAVCLMATMSSNTNPRTLVTEAELPWLRAQAMHSTSYAEFLKATQARNDAYFKTQPDVPLPKDPGGGYTHEQHKKNGIAIYESGLLHSFTGEPRFAEYAKDLLNEYSLLYPELDTHPVKRSNYPGRMFWQVLNESVFLVYAIQGYDAIRSELTEEEQEQIERGLFRPLADFLSIGSKATFDRIHNHAAWAVAGVGMTGYVIGDQDYVELALHGTQGDGSSGFLKLVDSLFSPDGYYTEGPYYQRYALMPFALFARVIENNDPDRRIFEYRDGVLLRAITTCIELSYNGLFFPINDAIKDKGLATIELRYGVAIAFALSGNQELVDIAKRQGEFVLTGDSLRVAQSIDAGKTQPFQFKSKLIRDGAYGKQGALGILRDAFSHTDQAVVFKATSHGFGHGHFDRLNWLYFDQGNEIVSDYGAVRFLNIEQKAGGRYLPENNTWAKQSIAHNTMVVDETSHFDGDADLADRHHPTVTQFDVDLDIKLIRGSTNNAYADVSLDRLIALVEGIVAEKSLVVDIYTVKSKDRHQLDLPVHFEGQFIATSSEPHSVAEGQLQPLGEQNGYQHLWQRSHHDVASADSFSVTWLNDGRFYSMILTTDSPTQVLFTQLGANDPNFNLRPQQAFIRRAVNVDSAVFVSVLETHGEYNGTAEYTVNNTPETLKLGYFESDENQVIRLSTVDDDIYYLAFSRTPSFGTQHKLTVDETELTWEGNAAKFDATGKQI